MLYNNSSVISQIHSHIILVEKRRISFLCVILKWIYWPFNRNHENIAMSDSVIYQILFELSHIIIVDGRAFLFYSLNHTKISNMDICLALRSALV